MTTCEQDQQLLLLFRQHHSSKSLDKFSYPKSNKHKTTRFGREELATITPSHHSRRRRRRRSFINPADKFKSATLRQGEINRQQVNNLNASLTLIVIVVVSSFIITSSHYQPVSAFNIDTQSAIVHSGPSNSYFGYTVAQHIDRGINWLLVGAPKAQTSQSGVKEGGAVYKCSTSVSGAIQQIPFDSSGPSFVQLGNESLQSDDKSHQWFGASLGSAIENGSIIACAPKYVYFSTNLKRPRRDPVGTCFVSRGSFGGFLEYSPCRLNGKYLTDRTFYGWGFNKLTYLLSTPFATRSMGTSSSWFLSSRIFKCNFKGKFSNHFSKLHKLSINKIEFGII